MPWFSGNTLVIRGCGTYRKSKLCGTTSHGLGLGGFFRVWINVQKANIIFWLGMRRAEICTVLQSVLGEVDVAVCLDNNMLIEGLPHHTQFFLRVRTIASETVPT